MPSINVSRDVRANTVARINVPVSSTFSYVGKDGKPLKNTYAAIGNSGSDDRMFSINLATGELASGRAKDAQRKAIIRGAYEFQANINPDATKHVLKSRVDVASGEVFTVPNAKRPAGTKPVLYGHVGQVDDGRFLSVNFATQELASTKKDDSKVLVVGTYVLNATVTG